MQVTGKGLTDAELANLKRSCKHMDSLTNVEHHQRHGNLSLS